MQTLEAPAAVLFVNEKEEDTRFLTRDLSMPFIYANSLGNARWQMKRQRVRSVVVDIASAEPWDITDIKRQSRDVKVFVLANPSEVPLAIEYVKQGGANGFLVKGLSDSDTILKLMQYATSQHTS